MASFIARLIEWFDWTPQDEIVRLLERNGEMTGRQLWSSHRRLHRSTIYVILSRMEDVGLISSRPVGNGIRIYKLIHAGRRNRNDALAGLAVA